MPSSMYSQSIICVIPSTYNPSLYAPLAYRRGCTLPLRDCRHLGCSSTPLPVLLPGQTARLHFQSIAMADSKSPPRLSSSHNSSSALSTSPTLSTSPVFSALTSRRRSSGSQSISLAPGLRPAASAKGRETAAASRFTFDTRDGSSSARKLTIKNARGSHESVRPRYSRGH